jgi:hypothetical protein
MALHGRSSLFTPSLVSDDERAWAQQVLGAECKLLPELFGLTSLPHSISEKNPSVPGQQVQYMN